MWIDDNGKLVADGASYVAPNGTQYPAEFPKEEVKELTPLVDVRPPLTAAQQYGMPYVVGNNYVYPVEDIPAEQIAKLIAVKVARLWESANDYTTSYISGVAIGILTIGVIQQKPKCLAVAAWSSAVWAEYYRRKGMVTAVSTEDLDFSSFGPMPYSVPELQAEVGL